MDKLYICNSYSNYISQINLINDREKMLYISDDKDIIGIHGITLEGDKLYIAANNSDSFYIFSLKDEGVSSFDIGMKTSDIRFIERYAYLIGSDTNCLIVYDIEHRCICYEIKCGNYPHSMDVSSQCNLISITNMYNNEITIVDYSINDFIKNIRTGDIPTISKFYNNGKHIFVCESNLGHEKYGTLSVYDVKTGERNNTITLSKSPVDMYIDNDFKTIFVSNHLGECISIIDINSFKEISRIYISGMPRGMYRKGRFLYIVITDKNRVIKYDILTGIQESIEVGLYPTCIYSY